MNQSYKSLAIGICFHLMCPSNKAELWLISLALQVQVSQYLFIAKVDRRWLPQVRIFLSTNSTLMNVQNFAQYNLVLKSANEVNDECTPLFPIT